MLSSCNWLRKSDAVGTSEQIFSIVSGTVGRTALLLGEVTLGIASPIQRSACAHL